MSILKKSNIIFLGGIHGVGKGVICHKISNHLNSVSHISASKILKWSEISNAKNKLVQNLETTQSRLIDGLKNIVEEEKKYILDGHFCLLNRFGNPEKIDLKTFILINPEAIFVVEEDVKVIKKSLQNRDNCEFNIDILGEMQKMELESAREVAFSLKIPFHKINRNNYSKLTEYLLSQIEK